MVTNSVLIHPELNQNRHPVDDDDDDDARTSGCWVGRIELQLIGGRPARFRVTR
jgi:hypothetical protein